MCVINVVPVLTLDNETFEEEKIVGSEYFVEKTLQNVTCSEKRDHSGYFIKIEFLAWIDSSMCAESNGASFMKKYRSQVEL